MTEITIVSVVPSQDDIMRLALEVAQLPTDDLDQPGRMFFRMAGATGVIGYVGLEGSGSDRLLRSLVVLPSRRGQGYGAALVTEVERLAKDDGVERLHLLTASAATWFRDRGYHDLNRDRAPPGIAGTAQFSTLCPASARYLMKAL